MPRSRGVMGRSVGPDRPAPSLLLGTAAPPLNRIMERKGWHDHRRSPRAVTGGIDTHGEVHVAAVLDEVGGLLGTQSFRADPDGYSDLLAWLQAFGEISKIGVEGTGSYGAGIARHLARAGVHVVEVDRQNRGPASKRQVRSPRRRRGRPGGTVGPGPWKGQVQGRLGRGHPGPRRGQALGPRGRGSRRSARCASSPSAPLTSCRAGSRVSPSPPSSLPRRACARTALA